MYRLRGTSFREDHFVSLEDAPLRLLKEARGNLGVEAREQAYCRRVAGSVVTNLEVILMGQPEVYFQTKPGLIDDDLNVTDSDTPAFLEGYITRLTNWIQRHTQDAVSIVAAE